jgi:hypothetical protein
MAVRAELLTWSRSIYEVDLSKVLANRTLSLTRGQIMTVLEKAHIFRYAIF